jgi:hypothetical protein
MVNKLTAKRYFYGEGPVSLAAPFCASVKRSSHDLRAECASGLTGNP